MLKAKGCGGMSVSEKFRADCGTPSFDIRGYKGPRFADEIRTPEDADAYLNFLREAPTELIFPQSRIFRFWRKIKFALKG